ncbi:MAG: hypothetical protein J7M25_17605 [Deltaproteobacteria bacterium]|nr:hypothetical protein [Deltaproteobacteria bacterium]
MLDDREDARSWRRQITSIHDTVYGPLLVVMVGFWGLDIAQTVRASAGRVERPAPQVVMVVGKGGKPPLADVVQSQLVDTRTRLQVVSVQQLPQQGRDKFALARRLGAIRGSLLVFWCYEPFSGFAMLNMFDPKTNGLVLRPVPSCHSPEGTEAAALIVRSSVEALLAGGRIGGRTIAKPRPSAGHKRSKHGPPRSRKRTEKAPGVHRQVVHAVARPPFRMEVALAYRLKTFGPKVPLVHEGDLVLWMRLFPNVWLSVGAGLAQSVRGRTGYGSMVMKRFPLSLSAAYLWKGGSWRFGVVSGLGFEYRRLAFRPAEGVILSREKSSDQEVTWNGGARASLRILGRARIFLQIGVEAIVAGSTVFSFGSSMESFQVRSISTTLLSLQPARFLSVVGLSVVAM